jgi:hypothetical protein
LGNKTNPNTEPKNGNPSSLFISDLLFFFYENALEKSPFRKKRYENKPLPYVGPIKYVNGVATDQYSAA